MERYGLNRDQAVEHIKQVAEDEDEVKQILPQELTPPASGDDAQRRAGCTAGRADATAG